MTRLIFYFIFCCFMISPAGAENSYRAEIRDPAYCDGVNDASRDYHFLKIIPEENLSSRAKEVLQKAEILLDAVGYDMSLCWEAQNGSEVLFEKYALNMIQVQDTHAENLNEYIDVITDGFHPNVKKALLESEE